MQEEKAGKWSAEMGPPRVGRVMNGRWRSVCWAGTGLVAFVGLAIPLCRSAVADEGCPNAIVRSQQGVSLARCRAYELVTPVKKGSGEPEPAFLGEVREGREFEPLTQATVLAGPNGVQAGIAGNRLAWSSDPLPIATAPGLNYLSERVAGGWTSEDLVPPMSPYNDLLCPLLLGVAGWSPDLSRFVLDLPAGAPRGFHEERECGHDEPRLVSGEPEHFRNLFMHEVDTGKNWLVNVTPPTAVWPEAEVINKDYWPASFLAASDDFTHVVFEEELALTPDAAVGYPGGDELYEWSDGTVKLVTILPSGTPVHGTLAGATRNWAAESELAGDQASNIAQFRHAISSDGLRVFFEAEGGLYVREGGIQTVQLDRSEGSGASGGGHFMVASADGSRAFFTDDHRLTADATAEAGKPDLYEYDLGAGTLRDVTVTLGGPADVLGVSGASEDGTYVYVVARGVLTEGPNPHGDHPVEGDANLYLIHTNTRQFIAGLDPNNDNCDWAGNEKCGSEDVSSSITARITASGKFIGFNSVRSLTGYDNVSATSGQRVYEIYLYDVEHGTLSCVSCNPSGTPPSGGAAIHWPVKQGRNEFLSNSYPQRNVANSGQVFFETLDPLVPRDINGRRDVYEYDAGTLSLISTGVSEEGSHFLDATPDGSDVFFSTTQRLLPRDTDSVYDYYDAHVGGGFVEPSSTTPPCDGESCRGPGGSAPASASPATAAFEGPGNPTAVRCRKGAVRRHGRCVKKTHRHRQRARHPHRATRRDLRPIRRPAARAARRPRR
jgi:hypothetical protein